MLFLEKILTLKVPKTKIQVIEFANSIDPDEITLHEPPLLDLHCLLYRL